MATSMNKNNLNILKNFARFIAPIYILIICILSLILGGKNITDEEMAPLNGDMPRYLMNGAYLVDLFREFPIEKFFEFSGNYYAQYPALSLGHHPPLTSISEVPFFLLFGISVFSGKLTILFFALSGFIFWFMLIQRRFDGHIAFISTMLIISTPFIVSYSRMVMSEIPALALLIISAYYFQQYLLEDEKRKYLIAFLASFILSIYAKQTTIILGLAFAWEFLGTKGFRKIFTKDILWSGVIFCIAMIPIGALSLKVSPSNVQHFSSAPIEYILGSKNFLSLVNILWIHHFTPPVLFLSVLGIALSFWKRDSRYWFFLIWILSFCFLMIFTGARSPRYSIYWIPAFCFFAASLIGFCRSRLGKIGMATIVLFIASSQVVMSYYMETRFARGYKEAAQYVVDNKKGTAVLYSAQVDTGYFIFQTRALDIDRKMVVLLADKLLATSYLGWIFEERIKKKDGIYKILKDYGVCHVVLEDKTFKSRSLELLRGELQREQFILKKTIPIKTHSPAQGGDDRLRGVDIKIYEYKSCGPPNPEATLDMNLPLINRSIKTRFEDLLEGL